MIGRKAVVCPAGLDSPLTFPPPLPPLPPSLSPSVASCQGIFGDYPEELSTICREVQLSLVGQTIM